MISAIPLTTRLLFVRHGQTDTTINNAFCGVTDAQLTPMGHRQAQALAERLRHERIDALYCSPQQRALDTAAPVADTQGLEIHQDNALREIDFGLWENRDRPTLLAEYSRLINAWDRGLWMGNPSGGETRQAVIARVIPCIIELLNKHTGKNIMVVSHRTTLCLLVSHMLDMPLSSSRRMQISPASLTELRVTGEHVQMIFFNDTSHLAALL